MTATRVSLSPSPLAPLAISFLPQCHRLSSSHSCPQFLVAPARVHPIPDVNFSAPSLSLSLSLSEVKSHSLILLTPSWPQCSAVLCVKEDLFVRRRGERLSSVNGTERDKEKGRILFSQQVSTRRPGYHLSLNAQRAEVTLITKLQHSK